MAYMVNVRVLVADGDQSRVIDGINEMLRAAQQPVEEGGEQWIVDWQVLSVDPVTKTIDDSICNETYAEGDAFKAWVIFSRSEAIAWDGAGFWSNDVGWTEKASATRFSEPDGMLPRCAGMDAAWMLDPAGLRYRRVTLVENEMDGNRSAIEFECWAEDAEHAREQAQNAYPGCRIVEVL